MSPSCSIDDQRPYINVCGAVPSNPADSREAGQVRRPQATSTNESANDPSFSTKSTWQTTYRGGILLSLPVFSMPSTEPLDVDRLSLVTELRFPSFR